MGQPTRPLTTRSFVTVTPPTTVPLRRSPGFRAGISIAIAVGLYGISFGALAVASGLTVWQAQALSLLMFTGGSQFAFIGVIAGSGTAPAAVTAATLLGLRNGIYGMQMNALLHPRGWRRILGAHVTIDESAAVAMGQQSPTEAARGFWAAGLGVFALWNAFTLVGALAGNAIGDPRQWGLDGAAVAAFVGLLWPRLRNREPVIIAVICALVTALFIPLLPPGIPILIAATVAAGLSFVARGPAHEGLEPDFPIDYDQGDRR